MGFISAVFFNTIEYVGGMLYHHLKLNLGIAM